MKNIRQQVQIWLQLVTFLIIWIVVLFFTNTELRINWEAIQQLPRVVVIYFIVFFIFTKWAWRLPSLQGWVVPFPNIQGTWQGSLQTTWSDPSSNSSPPPIFAILAIKQTFNSISCIMHTKESISVSNAASLSEDNESGIKRLSYNYTNKPRASVRDRSAMHDGAASLRIISDPERKLIGGYWTDRRSTGEMSFTFRSKKLLESFPNDL